MALKIDMHNAFNSVLRQFVLDECKEHFPELLPRAACRLVLRWPRRSPTQTVAPRTT